ncbi:rhodanese-like domain-containing protein [Nocardioides pinisoli]|uniref:Rhodanese-like domain-containing protein n=1 Tax=Nocardioides pinisoli TaxID=2950279 RepID=A0ABT1KWR4_9ACTN|nr:rhodanese-like domain-containing protein [Nocardioides pinisoli]MCP3422205.1 rhodanese-like domain-containing protein [Nocardioides pinisoli]
MSRRPTERLAALASVAVLLVGAAACGAEEPVETVGSAATSAADTAEPIPAADALARVADGAEVIDVRTPEEFDAGHLDGAVNIDYQADDFADRVEELPREASYVVYCASGRRATGAVEQMRDLGFTDVVNGGGYADLAG